MTSVPSSESMPTENILPTTLSPVTYTLYYHQRLRRYLITSDHQPTADFIEKPGEGSYKLFGGRRDSSQDVHEIGRAGSVDELKQFVMVMNMIIRFNDTQENISHRSIRRAFEERLSNLTISIQ